MVRSHIPPSNGSSMEVIRRCFILVTRELIWSDLVMVCAARKLVYSTIDYVSIYYELDNIDHSLNRYTP